MTEQPCEMIGAILLHKLEQALRPELWMFWFFARQ